MKATYKINCMYKSQLVQGRLEVINEENDIVINLHLDEIFFCAQSENYFYALLELRKKLECQNIKLLCKGCCRNVYPSPMSIDMCGGLVAYSMEMGEEANKKVRIFDDCELEEYATIEEQILFYKQWYEDILLVRKLKDETEIND